MAASKRKTGANGNVTRNHAIASDMSHAAKSSADSDVKRSDSLVSSALQLVPALIDYQMVL